MRVEPASLSDTEAWCKWVYSIPHNPTRNVHPLRGGESDQKQNHQNLFFLAGTDGHQGGEALQRKVKVPSGKALVFPVILTMHSTAEFPGMKIDELLNEAKAENKNTSDRNLIINGRAETNLDKHLVQSETEFDINFPNHNILEVNPQDSKAVCAAYMAKVTPEGNDTGRTHMLQFGGKCDCGCGYSTNVRYQVSF
jgi:hypothetical protein